MGMAIAKALRPEWAWLQGHGGQEAERRRGEVGQAAARGLSLGVQALESLGFPVRQAIRVWRQL